MDLCLSFAQKRKLHSTCWRGDRCPEISCALSIGQYFVLVYRLMWPFSGFPISALLGFTLGFLIELLIVFVHGGNGEQQFCMALAVSLVFVLFLRLCLQMAVITFKLFGALVYILANGVWAYLYSHHSSPSCYAITSSICNKNKTIFESSNAARLEGYTIAHSGQCGECSMWQDLRLQFTIRD